jgi:hypothetical protein
MRRRNGQPNTAPGSASGTKQIMRMTSAKKNEDDVTSSQRIFKHEYSILNHGERMIILWDANSSRSSCWRFVLFLLYEQQQQQQCLRCEAFCYYDRTLLAYYFCGDKDFRESATAGAQPHTAASNADGWSAVVVAAAAVVTQLRNVLD